MKTAALSLLITLLSPPVGAMAQDWALGGFDAVASRGAGHAVPGRSDVVTMWKGKLWHFATEDNRARFEADPRAYAPGFAGFCPMSLSEGRREKGNPRHVVVIGKHLYLMRSEAAARRILAAPRKTLEKAKQNWRKLK
ncbi:hypothetical protein J7376_06500 [Paracoccus sp. R12_1]|jgi:YHS domain-containing protein|uniref:YHS domain-containing (seleno)protein n=1 Tax=unclassified Paracoccus (in: a-proteobacteria) TaxID=2688777 RepID=UPI000C092194|nr:MULTISPECIES: YHS domain-containing (seleno)protein [unclassified Paracoccus (in: a-proteobacteria)]MBO9454611.1 hypothetical protein [Paracoccus sp. R12_2]MBO9486165.1 hypothetical protein [Paracoccus sp. R12_1]PHQ70794.1 MAG: hypothetical protein COB97_03855 [Paracoccus sp. (in: a-proteobacteria)]